MKLWLVAIALILLSLSKAYAGVDLDQEMPRSFSVGHSTLPQVLSEKPPIDLTPGFPGIADQGELGGCQSFAMAAWLDYLFYFKTGHVIDISEKQLAYKLLSFMIDEFWDPNSQSYPPTYLGKSLLEARPYLGSGIAPLMLAAYFRGYAIPDGLYSFGNLRSTDGFTGVDFDTFNKFFGDSASTLKRDDYLAELPVAFLSAPPERFIYNLRGVDFSNGNPENLTLKTPKDIADLVGVDPSNVVSYYNLDFQGYQRPMNKMDVSELMNYLVTVSQHLGQRGQTLGGSQLLTTIKQSLDQRMAVMIAANVWIGDWGSGRPMTTGGGHAMVIVGYQERSDGYIYFKLRNSWGADRLVQGYDYVRSDILIANTLYIVTHQAALRLPNAS
jgi:hypothetical protein